MAKAIIFQTNTYDLFNQLVAVTNNNHTASYTYRADGLRLSKAVNNGTTNNPAATTTITHIWDGSFIVLEMQINPSINPDNPNNPHITNRFLRGAGGQLIHSYHHGWYLFNARGDVIQRVDSQGQILHNYLYDAFGNEVDLTLHNTDPNNPDNDNNNPDNDNNNSNNPNNPDNDNSNSNNPNNPYNDNNPATNAPINTNPWRFAGEYWDFETQTYYLRARYFNPRTGRFTQPDPFWGVHNMQGSLGITGARGNPHPWHIMQAGNLFVYTMGNPVFFVDPSGEFALPFLPAVKPVAKWIYYLLFGVGTGAVAHGSAQSLSNLFSSSGSVQRQIAQAGSATVGGAPSGTSFIPHSVATAIGIAYMESQDVRTWVSSMVTSGGINRHNTNNHSVYVLRNPARDNEVIYVGRSVDPYGRLLAHRRDPRFEGIERIEQTILMTGLSQFQARATEQILISAFTLDALFNKINSIAMNNWHEANAQFERMQTLVMRR